ncbi:unnamed protein product [Rotaria magnacalcarata]|uniref:Ubiquitin-like domain-containing protein n=1 Tax=Rotaria magnacalcarata TaxID=392030 RepID=A0A820F7P0_9BILA|nr:unnamed protein product [Rotaria magnacalcarata]CAF1347552.1 unnamed protein product [Rotaria magnacalcarata]CAF2038130.1 unnamed protein product [Rotaria magnacalcarata]CAF2070646.1 unnamed protein product [Rotaria magnacalcarata]CAF3952704.1 unnamed protein product [Rotaria magnacalcarata]
MQLFVKDLNDRTITIEVEPDDYISKIKQRISERNGIPIEEQRLMWAGKQLINEKQIKDYGLQDGNTLFLVLRLKGG